MLKVLILCSFFRIPENLVRVSNKNTQKTNYEFFFHVSLGGRTIVSNEAFFGVWGWGHSNLHVLYKCMCMRWLKQI